MALRKKVSSSALRAGLLLVLLAILLPGGLQAQTVNLGGTGALGEFLNPLTVTDIATPEACNYDLLRVDLAQGKVFARPYRNASNVACDTILVDVTSQVFGTPPAGPINDGLLEVTNFTLRQPVVGSYGQNVTLDFVPNANNTPVIIRATGNVNIQSAQILSIAGQAGTVNINLLRGKGGAGGPGGYRGGDGGNGGLSPSAGQTGFGPGGGPGGAVGANASGAKALTTGATVAGTTIPTGNDLLTMLRGGSGGGGGGGNTGSAGIGGTGGGGAILIAANNTITVNGTLTARGGGGLCCPGSGIRASVGAGGVVRLVASTIAGAGTVRADAGDYAGGYTISSEDGFIRLEAYNISYTGGLTGGVAAASAPGQIIISTGETAFIRISKLTDANNAANTITVPLTMQATPGRTGVINPADITMPNPAGAPASTTTVEFVAGPNTVALPFPSGKSITLVVTPLDPGQGTAAPYTAGINCPSPGAGDCTASVNVALPLGFSSLSAFAVINLTTAGQLARMFPRTYEGETIESVRIETNGKEMGYVLIANSGREFPYRPGR